MLLHRIPALAFCAFLTSFTASAASTDYRFEVVTPHLDTSSTAAIAVRLIHVPTGRPVTDAVILPARLEMMMGNAPMVAKAMPQGSDGKGTYRLVADVSMEGTWTLKLSAKAQGEAETITGAIPVFAAKDARGHSGH